MPERERERNREYKAYLSDFFDHDNFPSLPECKFYDVADLSEELGEDEIEVHVLLGINPVAVPAISTRSKEGKKEA